jgi:hypothetical protein
VSRVPRRVWAAGLLLALAVALLSPLASPYPDGLERVAETQGFSDRARPARCGLIPDYAMPGVDNPTAATLAAGLTGTLLVGGLVYALARAARRRAGP